MSKGVFFQSILAIAVFSAIRLPANPFPGNFIAACKSVVEHMMEKGINGFDNLTVEQQTFLEDHFLPSVGMRGLMAEPMVARTCGVGGGCLIIGGFKSSKNLRFEWV